MARDFNGKVELRRFLSFLSPFPHFRNTALSFPRHHDPFTIIPNSNAASFIFTFLAAAIHVLSALSLHNAPLLHLTDSCTPPPPRSTRPLLQPLTTLAFQTISTSCMTAPTQELPSWLSYSSSVATNDQGDPTATFTTVINLPLTYYGPSVSFSKIYLSFLF
jgi:hypothetical protein